MNDLFIIDSLEDLINSHVANTSENFYEREDVEVVEWLSNWDFDKKRTDLYTHKIHRYPAMFIPQVTRKLIQKFSKKGDRLLDIFSGSGSLLVEAKLLQRHSIGIEYNPLAVLISKVKTTPLNLEYIPVSYKLIHEKYFDDNFKFQEKNFKNIDFWFNETGKENLSKLYSCIQKVSDNNIKDFFEITLSEIIREVSTCRHNGFKMHRSPEKVSKKWSLDEIFSLYHKTLIKNIKGIVEFQKALSEDYKSEIIFGDSRKIQNIAEGEIDLIITSPPYGDSHTTVAYGQFSRLCSQWLDLDKRYGVDAISVDNELLGGRTNGVELEDDVMNQSITLRGVKEIFFSRLTSLDKKSKDYTKLKTRFKDVISFYKDLDLTLKNGYYYLRPEGYFILVTGSRIVKDVKLHTDIIISELGERYGFELQAILYRNIINKRMPSKVSATNIVGETASTMTKESIVILKKMRT